MKNLTDKYDLYWIAEKIKQKNHIPCVIYVLSFDDGNRIEHMKYEDRIFVVSAIGLLENEVMELNELLNN